MRLYNCLMQSLESGAIGLLDFMLARCPGLCIFKVRPLLLRFDDGSPVVHASVKLFSYPQLEFSSFP